jgi:hypothetical protein
MMFDSERRPGLGAVLFAVYGITPNMRETRVRRSAGGLVQKAIKAARVILRRRTNSNK